MSQFIPDLTVLSLKPRKTGLAITARLEPLGKVTLILRWPEVVLITLFLTVGWLIIRFRKPIVDTWLISQWAPSHLHEMVIAITVIAGIAGLLLATWKKKQLFTYGIAEIAFALFTVFQISLHLWPTGRLVDFLGLGSALYVASRGFGNVWDAFVQETEIKRLELQVGDIVKAVRFAGDGK
jgi:hypothetical protein